MDWSRFKNIDPGAVAEVVRNPADHPISIAFLLAIATLVLLIGLLIVLVTLVGRQDSPKRKSSGAGKPRQGPSGGRTGTQPSGSTVPPVGAATPRPSESRPEERRRPPSGLMLALIVIAFGLSVYVPGSFSSTCSSCHTVAYETESWMKGPHADVACVKCHEPRPALLFAENAIDRASNTGRWLLSKPTSATATTVDDAGCVRCHESDIVRTTQSGAAGGAVRMRHADVRRAGYHCTDCHRDTGHAVVGGAPSGVGSMRRCLTCHDNRTASSDCSVCHPRDVMLSSVANADPYPKVELAEKKDCEGCHSMKKCDGCHGLRLPHPQAFVDGEHARLAAYEKKKACWRCHTPEDCAACHTLYPGHFSAHAPGWKYNHGTPSRLDDPNACRVCHNIKVGKPFCRFCHPK